MESDKPAYIAIIAAPSDSRPGVTVHPVTGLSTDYLNHFNEAIMLLDMLRDCPDCVDDLSNWYPMSYCDHFIRSGHDNRQDIIAAYGQACPDARQGLALLADIMTDMLRNTLVALRQAANPDDAAHLAATTAANLKPLVASAGAIINGSIETNVLNVMTPQAAIDRLMAS